MRRRDRRRRRLLICGIAGYRDDTPYSHRPPAPRRDGARADGQQRPHPRQQRAAAAACTRTETDDVIDELTERHARVPRRAARRRRCSSPPASPASTAVGAFEDVVDGLDAPWCAARRHRDGPTCCAFPPLHARGRRSSAPDYLRVLPAPGGSGLHVRRRRRGPRAPARAARRAATTGRASSSRPRSCSRRPPATRVYPTLAGHAARRAAVLSTCVGYCFRHEPSGRPGAHADVPHARVRPRRHARRRARAAATTGSSAALDAPRRPRARPPRPTSPTTRSSAAPAAMLAASQREQAAEVRAPRPDLRRRAPHRVASFNYHQDHFGTPFDIRTADGEVAHTACVGFGLERIALALLRHHGLDIRAWPAPVRARAVAVTTTPVALLPLDPATYAAHPLHATDRDWTGDELLRRPLDRGAARARPRPCAGLASAPSARDFEGDQWTFFKFPPEDLRALYGIEVTS